MIPGLKIGDGKPRGPAILFVALLLPPKLRQIKLRHMALWLPKTE